MGQSVQIPTDLAERFIHLFLLGNEGGKVFMLRYYIQQKISTDQVFHIGTIRALEADSCANLGGGLPSIIQHTANLRQISHDFFVPSTMPTVTRVVANLHILVYEDQCS